jgi:hypothetical protein
VEEGPHLAEVAPESDVPVVAADDAGAEADGEHGLAEEADCDDGLAEPNEQRRSLWKRWSDLGSSGGAKRARLTRRNVVREALDDAAGVGATADDVV